LIDYQALLLKSIKRLDLIASQPRKSKKSSLNAMNKKSGGVGFSWLGSLTVSGILIFSPSQALAQITPDNTLGDENSVVNSRDATNDSIDGGAIRGQNLFHSFSEFNVDAGRGVYFANPEAVTNIFSRVTGNDVSDILGTLGVDGAANLFLINPNGIIFGEGASLDVNGSFAATTADGIEFGEQGFFSASNRESPKLLTINPSAYLFNQVAPGAIVNNSTTNDIGLQVQSKKNLSLIGGDITLDSGLITASGGKVELGGLSAAGKIEFNENGGLTFPDGVTRSDLSLSNGASIFLFGDGGSINVNSRNLSLSGTSGLFTSIIGDFGGEGTVAGDINIDATNEIRASQGSRIQSRVFENSIGDGGNINIQTGSLILREGSIVSNSTYGNGNAGNVTINASDNISADGFGNEGIPSGVFGNVSLENAVGNAGEIKINTSNLTLTNGGVVNSVTFGEGNTGKVTINASDSIFVNGEAEDPFFNSGIFSGIDSTAKGNSGGIEISTNNLSVTNGGQINTGTLGQGDAGSINIQAQYLSVKNGGEIDSSTFGEGDAGKVTIDASNSISLDDGGIGSEIVDTAKGNSEGIEITTTNLSLANEGIISATTLGNGNAGKVTIKASDSVSIDSGSGIGSLVEQTAKGNSGGIEITTDNLSLANGSLIDASTLGEGNAGKININASDSIVVDGFNSVIFSNVEQTAKGSSEGIEITTSSLNLTNDGQINTSTFGKENAGSINIQAQFLSLEDGGAINSRTSGKGNGGSITINADDAVTITGVSEDIPISSQITTETYGAGDGGSIQITAQSLFLAKGGAINSSTNLSGNGGDITIDVDDSVTLNGESNNRFNSVITASSYSLVQFKSGNGGNIEIKARDLALENGAIISSGVSGVLSFAKPGDIAIDVDDSVTLSGENKDGDTSTISNNTFAIKEDAGDIRIKARSLSLANGAEISSSSDVIGFANAGNITIDVDDSVILNGISQDGSPSRIATDASGGNIGGDIRIQARSLSLENGAEISSKLDSELIDSESASGEGGNINLQINDNIILRDSDISTQAIDSANGGNINITADGVIAFDDSDIFAFTADGKGGNINLNTPAYFAENFTLNSLTANPDFLDNNSRADLNATGAVSGAVTIPDVSFIQNSLNDLPNNSINTDELVANSCVSPVGNIQQGKFIITGKGGLPVRPGNGSISDFSTGEVRSVPSNKTGWQRGEPIVEPQGLYHLANGKLVLSRECR
jgi:filamentous hemagglutinin family protein